MAALTPTNNNHAHDTHQITPPVTTKPLSPPQISPAMRSIINNIALRQFASVLFIGSCVALLAVAAIYIIPAVAFGSSVSATTAAQMACIIEASSLVIGAVAAMVKRHFALLMLRKAAFKALKEQQQQLQQQIVTPNLPISLPAPPKPAVAQPETRLLPITIEIHADVKEYLEAIINQLESNTTAPSPTTDNLSTAEELESTNDDDDTVTAQEDVEPDFMNDEAINHDQTRVGPLTNEIIPNDIDYNVGTPEANEAFRQGNMSEGNRLGYKPAYTRALIHYLKAAALDHPLAKEKIREMITNGNTIGHPKIYALNNSEGIRFLDAVRYYLFNPPQSTVLTPAFLFEIMLSIATKFNAQATQLTGKKNQAPYIIAAAEWAKNVALNGLGIIPSNHFIQAVDFVFNGFYNQNNEYVKYHFGLFKFALREKQAAHLLTQLHFIQRPKPVEVYPEIVSEQQIGELGLRKVLKSNLLSRNAPKHNNKAFVGVAQSEMEKNTRMIAAFIRKLEEQFPEVAKQIKDGQADKV